MLLLLLLVACSSKDDGSSGSVDSTDELDGRVGSACTEHEDCFEGLKCEFGSCSRVNCVLGERGCYCSEDEACTSSLDECVSDRCSPKDCEPGDENCACSGGVCGAGLYCLDGTICVDSEGYSGGACLPNGSCHSGLSCDTYLERCIPCVAGEAGCDCLGDGSCGTGLQCTSGRCSVRTGGVPLDPICYSPCSSESIDGSIQCDSDGLAEGCFDGQECAENSGSCVAEGEKAPTCVDDFDCTDFQTCLEGRCYSNCTQNSDCPAGLGCSRKVCRISCQTSAAEPCPTNYVCKAEDSENGYCHPLSDEKGEPQPEVEAVIELDKNAIALSNVISKDSLTITLNSDYEQELSIKALGHSVAWKSGVSESVEYSEECTGTSCPLWWLKIGGEAGGAKTLNVPAGGEFELEVEVGTLINASYWEGTFEIGGPNMPVLSVYVQYAEESDGRWSGTMTYFSNFNDEGIEELFSNPGNVKNGLLKRWSAFKLGRLDGWGEFVAVLNATEEGTWAIPGVQDECPVAACYPYAREGTVSGLKAYVANLADSPIPSGSASLPFAIDLYTDIRGTLHGKVASDVALHYPGYANVDLGFVGPISDDNSFISVAGDRLLYVDEFSVHAGLGGRTIPLDGACPKDYALSVTPWLVPGFERGVWGDTAGAKQKMECLQSDSPLLGSSDEISTLNQFLAKANPILDGRMRRRRLELVDGALVNSAELFILFKETMDPIQVGGEAIESYGFMRLSRALAALTDENENRIPDRFEEEAVEFDVSSSDSEEELFSCDSEILGDSLEVEEQVARLITGVQLEAGVAPQPTTENIYYLCHDTGKFAGAPVDDQLFQDCAITLDDASEPSWGDCDLSDSYCPAGSSVTYFALKPGFSQEQIQQIVTDHPCRQDGECQVVYDLWVSTHEVDGPLREGQWEPTWSCSPVEIGGQLITPNHCDENRLDLRDGKEFYFAEDDAAQQVFPPIHQAIESAFRYKTRFTTRSGASIGFAPEICSTSTGTMEYCYDPEEIEQLLDRVDCLVQIYRDNPDDESIQLAAAAYLSDNFGAETVYVDQFGTELASPVTYDGFEKLYAELIIMLGDEALSRAYSSRFDLAGAGLVTFPGDELEDDGVRLTGVAGYEMYSLYQAAQYYESVLDRFYRMTGPMWASLEYPLESSKNFITQETVFNYLGRVVHASTQLARTWEKVASHYQSINRADLARRVIERAYLRAHNEEVILGGLVEEVGKQSAASEQTALAAMKDGAMKHYQMALHGMREVYESLTDDITFFGFSPDYVPFPSLDPNAITTSAVDVLIADVETNKLPLAKAREETAKASDRSLAMDSARFETELTAIETNYENQLADICGNFVGTDGEVYPAIARYAYLSAEGVRSADPCGTFEGGRLAASMTEIQTQALLLEEANEVLERTVDLINIEVERASSQCDAIEGAADFIEERGNHRINLEQEIRILQSVKETTLRVVGTATQLAQVSVDSKPLLPGLIIANTIAEAAAVGLDIASEVNQRQLDLYNVETEMKLKERECETVQIDSRARVAERLAEARGAEIAVYRQQLALQSAIAESTRLANEARRLARQWEEAVELQVDQEAARNDPNVRLYRNADVINADIAFDAALKAMYRLTRVYEYYTSQSYAKRDELFLTRTAATGTYSLENYLLDLKEAFFSFEEEFGNPDQRVMVVSLRDDVLKIPRVDENGGALTGDERLSLFHDELSNNKWLNKDGYLSFPFSTDLERVSPLTRNHKIFYIEAQIFGTGVGDKVARVYLQQSGTGVVRRVSDELEYYRFPNRTAVINPFFASRTFDASVYRNYRLRDMPLLNSRWNLILNMRDEYENLDIDLAQVDDVWLYVTYTDFTDYE